MRRTEQLVPLSALVAEGFGGTVGELVDLLAERGFAVLVDDAGRLSAADAVAVTLRAEKVEAERIAAQVAAEAAAEAAQRKAEAAAVEAAEEAEASRRREAQTRRHARIRRLEQAAGMSIVQLEMGLRSSLINAPDTGMSYDERQRLEDAAFSLDELERFVLERYNVDTLEEVTR
jgi:hypothetical protein